MSKRYKQVPENTKNLEPEVINKLLLFCGYLPITHNGLMNVIERNNPSNTRTLSRNISINNLYSKINIFPLALSDKTNIISFFKRKEQYAFTGNKFIVSPHLYFKK